MKSLITIENLDAGLDKWHAKKNWADDLPAEFYQRLRQKRDTLTPENYWVSLVDTLASWRAIRPYSKVEIITRGNQVLPEMRLRINEMKEKHFDEKRLTEMEWHDLEGFFDFCKKIKGVDSPVFASKMCHFIFPNLYPVIDNVFTGIHTGYNEYWRNCKLGWITCPNKDQIINHFILRTKLLPHPTYPYFTKIAEICSAGIR